jgi:hypothetical protein
MEMRNKGKVPIKATYAGSPQKVLRSRTYTIMERVIIGVIVAAFACPFVWLRQSYLQQKEAENQVKLELQKAEHEKELEAERAKFQSELAERDAELAKQNVMLKAQLQLREDAQSVASQKQLDAQRAESEKRLESQKLADQKQAEEARELHERQLTEAQRTAESQGAARERLHAHKKRVGELEAEPNATFRRIAFKNSCSQTVFVSMSYMALDGLWATKGWWIIPAGATADTEATRNNKFYHFAKTIDGQQNWGGALVKGDIDTEVSDSVAFERLNGDLFVGKADRTVLFRETTMTPPDSTRYVLELTCIK